MARKRRATSDANSPQPPGRRITRSTKSLLLPDKPVEAWKTKSKIHMKTKTENNDKLLQIGEDKDSERAYWLMKAEPETRIEKGKDVKFSIDDLAACDEPTGWDGVRNYGARNNIKAMKIGDLAFFYHSNCKEPGIVGVMEIVKEASIDETAFDPKEPYYDSKSDQSNPKWYLVHVEFRRKLERPIGLHELKEYMGGELKQMPLLTQGRLSVSAVPSDCWDFILGLEKKCR